MTKNKGNAPLKNWAIFSGIGLQMGIIIYLGNALGVWLDEKLEKSFIETTLTLVAIFGSMFLIIYRVNKFNANNK